MLGLHGLRRDYRVLVKLVLSVDNSNSRVTLYTRWKRGWSDEKTLTTPVEKKQVEYSELEYNNQTKSLSEWCNILDLDRKTMWKRLKRNWSVIDCFETPILNGTLRLKNIKAGSCG